MGIHKPDLILRRKRKLFELDRIEKVMMKSLCILLMLSFAGLSLGYRGGCYAPPFVYGGVCASSQAIFGSSNTRVKYSISVNGDTMICCKVRACGTGRSCSKFGMHYLGCTTGSTSQSFPWGNNVATPAIQCKGNPFGA